MKFIFYLFASIVIMSSCGITKSNSSTSNANIKPGISKDEVVSLIGKPYKSSFYYNDDKQLVDEYYYKERVLYGEFIYITSLLTFVDNKLISHEQIDEMPEESNVRKVKIIKEEVK